MNRYRYNYDLRDNILYYDVDKVPKCILFENINSALYYRDKIDKRRGDTNDDTNDRLTSKFIVLTNDGLDLCWSRPCNDRYFESIDGIVILNKLSDLDVIVLYNIIKRNSLRQFLSNEKQRVVELPSLPIFKESLVKHFTKGNENFVKDSTQQSFEFCVCMSENLSTEDAFITRCGHELCKLCSSSWFNINSTCPMCRTRLNCELIAKVVFVNLSSKSKVNWGERIKTCEQRDLKIYYCEIFFANFLFIE